MSNCLIKIFKYNWMWKVPLVPWGASGRTFPIVLISFMILLGFAFVNNISEGTADLSETSNSIWRLTITAGLVYGILLAVAFVLGPLKHRVHISMLGFSAGRLSYEKTEPAGFLFQLRMILVTLSALILINIVWTLLIHTLSWDLFPSPEYPFMDNGAGALYLLVTGFLVIILGPFAEEVFFRGYILPGLGHKTGTAGSLIISSLIFGFAHMSLSLVVPTFFMGFILGLLYLRTKSVLSCTVAHGLQNGMAFMALVLTGGS